MVISNGLSGGGFGGYPTGVVGGTQYSPFPTSTFNDPSNPFDDGNNSGLFDTGNSGSMYDATSSNFFNPYDNATFNFYSPTPSIPSGGGFDNSAYDFGRLEGTLDQYGQDLSNLNTRFGQLNNLGVGDVTSGVRNYFDANNPFSGLETSLAGLRSDFNNLSLPDVYQFGNMFGDQSDYLTSQMGDQFGNLSASMGSGFDSLGNRFSNLEREMGNGFSGLYGNQGFGGLSNSIANLSRDVGNIPTGLDFTNILGQGLSGLSDNLGGQFDSLGDRFTNQLGGVGSQLSNFEREMGNRLSGLYGDQGFGGISNALSGIEQSMSGLPDFYQFGDMLGGQYDDLTSYMGGQYDDLSGQISGITDSLPDIYQFGDMLGGQYDDLTGFMGDQFGGLDETLAGLSQEIGNIPTGLDFTNILGQGLDGLTDQFGGRFDTLSDQIAGSYRGPSFEQFGDMFSDQSDFLTGELRGILGEMIGDTGQMPTELGDFFTGLSASMNETPDQLSNEDLDYLTGRTGQLNEVGGIVAPEDTGYGEGYSLDEFEIGDQPVLDMPEINDYRDYLTNPLVDGVTGALGAANPFDTRMDAMLAGEDNVIDRQYEEALENINHQFGLTDNLGSPAYRQAIADLNRDRADSKIRLRSDFQQQAAATDESLRRNRLGDLSQALTQTTGLFTDEMDRQNLFQQQAIDDYYRNLAAAEAAYYRPLNYEDEGMRMAMGGIGQAISPSGSAANQGLMNASNMYSNAANQARQGGNALANTLMDFGQGAYNWYTNR